METIKELNTNELEQVNGGMRCVFSGYSSEPDAMFCFSSGEDGFGIVVCVYIGVGLGMNE